MKTYRLPHERSLDFMADAFSLTGADYQEDIVDYKIDDTDSGMIDYMDYFHCGTKSAGVFTCHHF